MFIPLQQTERGFPLMCHLLAGVQICGVYACEFQSHDHSAAECQRPGHKHEGEWWRLSRMEGAAGGDVRAAAAPVLCGFNVSAGSAEGAGGGAGQVGRPDAGADADL